MVVAFDLELDDPTEIYLLMFSRNGSVGIDAGRKHGLISAPLYEWKIVDGRLRIVDYDGSIVDELTLLARESSKVIVRRRNGKVVTFKLLPPPPNHALQRTEAGGRPFIHP